MANLYALLPLLFASACTWVTNREGVLLTSTPPGARILLDGLDTGHTTPHVLGLGGTFGRDHVITLTKKGYRPARRKLYQHTEGYTSQWIDGAYEINMPPLPFFWTIGDFLLPFGVRSQIVPGELHVKLYREDEPRIGFELLEDGAGADATSR